MSFAGRTFLADHSLTEIRRDVPPDDFRGDAEL